MKNNILNLAMLRLNEKTTFVWVIVCAVVLKCLVAQFLPIFGDEAYYLYWGRHFAGGYYDHPPMIGCWEAAFSAVSSASWWLRMPVIGVIVSVAISMVLWVSRYYEGSIARFITMLWFFSPLIFMEIIVIPDMPLLCLSFFASIFIFQGVEALENRAVFKRVILILMAGLFWGAGFLSKYFALFLLPGYLVFLYQRARSQLISSISLFFLGAAPCLIQHLYWNYHHCWATLFYQFLHHSHQKWQPFIYLSQMFLFLFCYATVIWWGDLFKRRREVTTQTLFQQYNGIMWMLPTLCFAITACLGKSPGLHWYFFITPYFFIWIGTRFSVATLNRKSVLMLSYTALIYLCTILILVFPPKILTTYLIERYGIKAILILNHDAVLKQIMPHLKDVDMVVVQSSYGFASSLELEMLRYTHTPIQKLPVVTLIGNHSKYGHVIDMNINMQAFKGKNLLFILNKPCDMTAYFDSVSTSKVTLVEQGQVKEVYFIKGTSFHPILYIDAFITPILKQHFCEKCRMGEGGYIS